MAPSVTHRRLWALYAICVLIGAGGWYLLGRRQPGGEGWDHSAYFTLFMPALIVVAGVLGFIIPSRPWRWAQALIWPQLIVMCALNPRGGPLLPLGVVIFGVLTLPCIAAGYAGAGIRRMRARDAGSAS
jgi:hypothetical protein